MALIEAPERQQQQPIADAVEGPASASWPFNRAAQAEAPEQAGSESSAASAMLAKYDEVQHGKGKGIAAVEEEEDDDDDADLGPDDWDDILSAWMSAVGLTDMLKASEQTESGANSGDGEFLPAFTVQ